MLPQNMARWHTTYFKLKEFEEKQKQEDYSDFPLTFSPKHIIKLFCERYPPYNQRKETSLSQKKKGGQEES